MPEIEYVWDELSDNVIEEYEDGVLSVSYDHEPGLYGNLLSQNRNGVTSYYHYDGRGDTVALTDDSGNVTDTKEYDAWGNVIASTGSTVTPYQYLGCKGFQTDIGGVYLRASLYQPTLARWLSLRITYFGTWRSQYILHFQKGNSPEQSLAKWRRNQLNQSEYLTQHHFENAAPPLGDETVWLANHGIPDAKSDEAVIQPRVRHISFGCSGKQCGPEV